MDAVSKNEGLPFTPDGLRMLVKQRPARDAMPKDTHYKIHGLTARLGKKKVAELIKRYGEGESARALAKEFNVAASALIRLLRDNHVVVRRKYLTPELKSLLVKEHEAGATVAELEDRHQVAHGSVLRTLHKAGVQMRAKAPRLREA